MNLPLKKYEVDIVIIGAGPAGISMAAEAIAAGVHPKKIAVIEKEKEHSWSIRKLYPEDKLVTANYKGEVGICRGIACIPDLSKAETLSYLDKVITDYKIDVFYQHPVSMIKKKDDSFEISSGNNVFISKVCVIAIGIFSKPNRPDYAIPANVASRIHYDVTSKVIHNEDVLVVGGGDTASEYAQFLAETGNKVTLSYRKKDFDRMNFINRYAILALLKKEVVKGMLESSIKDISLDNDQIKVTFLAHYPPLKVDRIVYALGGTTPSHFLKNIGIEFEGTKAKLTQEYETNISGLFLIGDLSSDKRGGSIISAFNSAHQAMGKAVKKYLRFNEHPTMRSIS